MRKFLIFIAISLAAVMLVSCSKSDKKERKFHIETTILQAATAELSSMLRFIRMSQTTYKVETGKYMECMPSPPDGGTDAAPDVWVDAGGFGDMGFRPDGLVRYQYAVTVSEDGKSYKITATGDLDANGTKVVHTTTDNNPMVTREPPDEY